MKADYSGSHPFGSWNLLRTCFGIKIGLLIAGSLVKVISYFGNVVLSSGFPRRVELSSDLPVMLGRLNKPRSASLAGFNMLFVCMPVVTGISRHVLCDQRLHTSFFSLA